MQKFETLQQPLLGELAISRKKKEKRKKEREKNAIYNGHLRFCQQPRASHALRSDQFRGHCVALFFRRTVWTATLGPKITYIKKVHHIEEIFTKVRSPEISMRINFNINQIRILDIHWTFGTLGQLPYSVWESCADQGRKCLMALTIRYEMPVMSGNITCDISVIFICFAEFICFACCWTIL